MKKGYKAFNKDMTCRGMQYEVGGRYTLGKAPTVCGEGFHYCENPVDVFEYYNFDVDNTRVCEIIAHGEIATGDDKCATNDIEIVREITWEEYLTYCNTGKGNSGLKNSGNRNTGNRNTGNRNTGYGNTGDYNTGNRNTGNRNTGNRNTGDYNTGDYNTGDYNTGNRNTGNRNTGYGNKTNFSNGVFCTVEPTVCFFNKESDMTLREFMNSEVYYALNRYFYLTQWICESDMTHEEKEANPTYETTGGYLKTFSYEEAWRNAWDRMNHYDRDLVMQLPNFDKQVFKEITGILIE